MAPGDVAKLAKSRGSTGTLLGTLPAIASAEELIYGCGAILRATLDLHRVQMIKALDAVRSTDA
jgi:hypothetical protein